MNDFISDKEHITFELLTDYVDGILDAASNKRISTHLENCKECAESISHIEYYYERFGDDREGFDKYLEETKGNILSNLNVALGKEDKPSVLWYNTLPAKIAATLLIIIIPASILIYNHQSKSANALVDSYISVPYHKPPITRGDPDQTMKLWREVAAKYENENYQEALVILDQIIAKNETLPMAHFYMGLCYLYGDNPKPDQSIVHLQKVVADQNPYYEQGLWYLSLAYLQADKKKLGKETLVRIIGYRQEEVNALLNKLE